MISERKLVSSHSSFWRNLMPMGESFVRFINSGKERFAHPAEPSSKVNRSSLVSELSFRIYECAAMARTPIRDVINNENLSADLAEQVRIYISRLENVSEVVPMTPMEMKDAAIWASRLENHVRDCAKEREITVRPHFNGCGIVDRCEGDLLIGTTLWELKNVERDFRLVDVRQLLTYCALNYSGKQFAIDSVGLVNARHGVFFKTSLSSLATMSAAMSESELLSEIVRYVSVDTPSR